MRVAPRQSDCSKSAAPALPLRERPILRRTRAAGSDEMTTHVGTGIGNDHFITVSYHSDNMTGLALYGDAGSDWQGIWTYQGGAETGTENWSRQ
jgi:hypothetical protein